MADGADVAVIGAGLAGLVAACEAAAGGARVVVLDQEGEQSLGGQAFWSLGGLFMVDTPEQRRLRLRDSLDLAWSDWQGSAGWDRAEDGHGRAMARAYVEFAAGPMRAWLHGLGMRWFPVPGWAERGGGLASGHGNSVPRFHITWGTGPGVIEPFIRLAREHEAAGRLRFAFRHRVTGLIGEGGRIAGVAGERLAEDGVERGRSSSRQVVGDFTLRAGAVIVASGGIGGDLARVRRAWPRDRLGEPPARMVLGVPAHVDGAMIDHAVAAGAHVVNGDRMWHYTEGLRNFAPIWPDHGIRVLPGPSSVWLDAHGARMEAPCLPGFDTLSTLKRILATGRDWSWFVTTRAIVEKEFALSGSEQNPDFTGRDWRLLFNSRILKRGRTPVRAFLEEGEDFLTASRLEELVPAMNALAGEALLDEGRVRREIEARDAQLRNAVSKDVQIMAMRSMRRYLGDRLIRIARPHAILDPANGPLVAVRMNIVTRKTLGGLATDARTRALDAAGAVIPGLFAAGEAAGFGAGAFHGYRSLEGTFLGGCLFSGRLAGREAVGREAVGREAGGRAA